MNELSEHPKEPTVGELAAEVARLKQRIEDLEDAHELDAAILRNSYKPLTSWNAAKGELGIDELVARRLAVVAAIVGSLPVAVFVKNGLDLRHAANTFYLVAPGFEQRDCVG